MSTVRNSAMIDKLSGEFQRRYEPNFAWKSMAATYRALLGLRGFWPMSGFDSIGDATDMSGLAHHLTRNPAAAGGPEYNYDNLAPYVDLDGTGDYLSHADHADFDILGTENHVVSAARGLTLGGWFYPISIPDAIAAALIAKSDYAVVANVSYALSIIPSGAGFNFSIQIGSGAALETLQPATVYSFNAWYNVIGFWEPSTTIGITINGATSTGVSAFAALGNSGSQLTIGAASGGAIRFLEGYASHPFVCAAFHNTAIRTSVFQQTCAAYGVKP